MRRACLTVLFAGLLLSSHAAAAHAQGARGSDVKRVTLYGPLARDHDTSRALYSFKTGTFERVGWDLNYGSLYLGEEHDWVQVSGGDKVRSALRDLGAYGWADTFAVPFVEPFPKLKEGERRVVAIDASGRDGDDGADGDGVVRPRAGRPRRDGVLKVDPVFARAVVGHMYVVRVVDAENDFYVLFRVESLTRGDNCTITWRRVQAPPAPDSAGKR